jgi:uncharacterized protein YndB with AHSA1/START domain
MTDSIDRTILITAPIERVWDIVTTPEHMGRWFGDAGAERDGDVIRMRWEEHGEAELRIVRDEAPSAFAYRWDANVGGIGDTLVEFTLTPEGDGTRVRVVESGWESLRTTEAEQERLREGNVGGWEHELGDLARYASQHVAA